MLQWLGIGVAIGTLLLTAFVLLVNLTDDTRVAARSTRTHTSMPAEDRTPSFRLPVTPVVTAPAVTDFELPDDAPAVQTGGRTAKRPGARSKPAGKPKAAIRTAPF